MGVQKRGVLAKLHERVQRLVEMALGGLLVTREELELAFELDELLVVEVVAHAEADVDEMILALGDLFKLPGIPADALDEGFFHHRPRLQLVEPALKLQVVRGLLLLLDGHRLGGKSMLEGIAADDLFAFGRGRPL